MVYKTKLKCKKCGKEIANLFFYERKGLRLGWIDRCYLYCSKCSAITRHDKVGAYSH